MMSRMSSGDHSKEHCVDVQHEWRRRHVPTILVRALPVLLGKTQEDEIREAYKSLGVDEFLNLHDERLKSIAPRTAAASRR